MKDALVLLSQSAAGLLIVDWHYYLVSKLNALKVWSVHLYMMMKRMAMEEYHCR